MSLPITILSSMTGRVTGVCREGSSPFVGFVLAFTSAAHRPGQVRWVGPELGAHNDEVYRGLLGMDEARLRELRGRGVI